MVRFSDCPAGTQSPLTAKVWKILHTFVFLSARRSLALRLFSVSRNRTTCERIRRSSNSLGCMLLIKNPVQVAHVSPFAGLQKLYREFESRSLRHAVWDAEKVGYTPWKTAGNRRNSATLALKPDQRKCPAERLSQALPPFSLEGTRAVRFERIQSANAIRSETDGFAKGSLTF